jgi:hypothetical protein
VERDRSGQMMRNLWELKGEIYWTLVQWEASGGRYPSRVSFQLPARSGRLLFLKRAANRVADRPGSLIGITAVIQLFDFFRYYW